MSSKDSCLKRTLSFIPRFMKLISVGKYNSGMYRNGKNQHSSVIGGILTLTIAVGMISYAYTVFYSIFNRMNYNLEETGRRILGYKYDRYPSLL